MHYSIHLTVTGEGRGGKRDASWRCPICFQMQQASDTTSSRIYQNLGCKCGAHFRREEERLWPVGRAPAKTLQGIYEGPDLKFQNYMEEGVYLMHIIFQEGTFDSMVQPCRMYWKCPSCSASKSTRRHLHVGNDAEWVYVQGETNLWCSSCEATLKRLDRLDHRICRRVFPVAVLGEYDPATLNRLELLIP